MLRVALVHDWLTGMRGGERCLEILCELFPHADLFTLLHVPGSVSPAIEDRRIVTSFIQRLPGAPRWYRRYLPLFAVAVERFDLRTYDLVISLSHCVAKGVRPAAGAVHLCYCFTPMRYVWDRYADYADHAGLVTRTALSAIAPMLRRWDVASSRRVHHFVAISRFVAERIRGCYGRTSDVLYPPVDTARFRADGPRGDFYAVVSALVPYKRVDLAVAAARRLGRPLVIVGSGPDERRLRALAGPATRFLGWRSDADVADLLARCRAVLFPGVEDFGIVPLEAMASGRPVIAYGVGGALETVVPPGGARPPTGLLFHEQRVEALVEAMLELERSVDDFEPKALRARAEEFDRELFKTRFREYIAARVPA